MSDADWRDCYIMDTRTKKGWRAVERYILPGKGTGFVFVCEQRACFLEVRKITDALGLLPEGVSPEDRKSVVAWALRRRQFLLDSCFKLAATGATVPHPFDPDHQEVSDG